MAGNTSRAGMSPHRLQRRRERVRTRPCCSRAFGTARLPQRPRNDDTKSRRLSGRRTLRKRKRAMRVRAEELLPVLQAPFGTSQGKFSVRGRSAIG